MARALRRPATLWLCFLLYAMLGWGYEVFLEVVVYRWGYSDRGLLLGPYCPIYGFGALLLILTLDKARRRPLRLGGADIRPLLIFVAIILLTTVVELLGSYLLEWLTGGWLWDYTGRFLNFQGRVCFDASLRFGLGGMLFLYVLQPVFERRFAALTDRALVGLALAGAVIFAADAAVTLFGRVI